MFTESVPNNIEKVCTPTYYAVLYWKYHIITKRQLKKFGMHNY